MLFEMIKTVVQNAPDCHVLVVGDIMLDVYDYCYTAHSRPSPERPDKLVFTAHRTTRAPGGAGNVAANLASLGVRTTLLSICGNDGNYFELKHLLDDAGIEHVLIRDETRPTPIKTRLYIDDEYLLRRDDESVHKVDRNTALTIRDVFGRVLDHVDSVILSDYNKGFFTEEDSQCLIRLCRERDIPVIVDFKPSNQSYFNNASVVAPNLVEAKALVPDFSIDDPLPGLNRLHDLLGADNVMVTLGAHGMLTYNGKEFCRINGRSVKAVDPCGCGDTVRACLTLGLISGLSLNNAAAFANYAASLVVQKLGTVTLLPHELIDGWKKIL